MRGIALVGDGVTGEAVDHRLKEWMQAVLEEA